MTKLLNLGRRRDLFVLVEDEITLSDIQRDLHVSWFGQTSNKGISPVIYAATEVDNLIELHGSSQLIDIIGSLYDNEPIGNYKYIFRDIEPIKVDGIIAFNYTRSNIIRADRFIDERSVVEVLDDGSVNYLKGAFIYNRTWRESDLPVLRLDAEVFELIKYSHIYIPRNTSTIHIDGCNPLRFEVNKGSKRKLMTLKGFIFGQESNTGMKYIHKNGNIYDLRRENINYESGTISRQQRKKHSANKVRKFIIDKFSGEYVLLPKNIYIVHVEKENGYSFHVMQIICKVGDDYFRMAETLKSLKRDYIEGLMSHFIKLKDEWVERKYKEMNL